MQNPGIFSFSFTLLILNFSVGNAWDCSNPPVTITVSKISDHANYTNIQSAIDFIPTNNDRWFYIQISAATYKEKVQIPSTKPCIFIEGAGSSSTIIEWDGHEMMNSSATFTSLATDMVAKGITFKNSYNHPPVLEDAGKYYGDTPAVAARIDGDRSAFIECAFIGVQDTLFDSRGRHYFHNCYIQGGIDFIFGFAQSIYEKCEIEYILGPDVPENVIGYMTAHGRESIDETTGFVFKECNITGKGKTYLGRAWRQFSRVIIYNSYLSDVVHPEGWDAWHFVGHEANLTYVEENCTGPGAQQSKRVPWIKHWDATEFNKFVNISYIDQEGWISKLPVFKYSCKINLSITCNNSSKVNVSIYVYVSYTLLSFILFHII